MTFASTFFSLVASVTASAGITQLVGCCHAKVEAVGTILNRSLVVGQFNHSKAMTPLDRRMTCQ